MRRVPLWVLVVAFLVLFNLGEIAYQAVQQWNCLSVCSPARGDLIRTFGGHQCKCVGRRGRWRSP